jgi:hypothetical protein
MSGIALTHKNLLNCECFLTNHLTNHEVIAGPIQSLFIADWQFFGLLKPLKTRHFTLYLRKGA